VRKNTCAINDTTACTAPELLLPHFAAAAAGTATARLAIGRTTHGMHMLAHTHVHDPHTNTHSYTHTLTRSHNPHTPWPAGLLSVRTPHPHRIEVPKWTSCPSCPTKEDGPG